MEIPDIQAIYLADAATQFQKAEEQAMESEYYEDEMSIDFWYEGKRWGNHKSPRTFCVAYAGDIRKFPRKEQAIGELARLRMLHPEAPVKRTQWVRMM